MLEGLANVGWASFLYGKIRFSIILHNFLKDGEC